MPEIDSSSKEGVKPGIYKPPKKCVNNYFLQPSSKCSRFFYAQSEVKAMFAKTENACRYSFYRTLLKKKAMRVEKRLLSNIIGFKKIFFV